VLTDAIGGKFQGVIAWAIDSVRHRGFLTTFKIAASTIEDSFFDRRFGTETRRVVYSEQLEAGLTNRAHAGCYQATKARPFLSLLRRLQFPDGSTFVDLGSGKGKVLLLAAQQQFKRVVGIEFSPSLCNQARKNIEIFRGKVRNLTPIEVFEEDVTQHALRGDENVFFLYYPFDAVILGQFLENIRRSVAAHPRQIWLIYNVPAHADVLDASGLFTQRDALTVCGNEFHVYTNGRQEPPGGTVVTG
jgi:SAM-dependent methyltransferase